jgi:erythronate-4-phosphate dehydrogenase
VRGAAVKIVADENIPFVEEGFGRLGEVRVLAGRGISREALSGVEMLIVRSVTKVNAKLLDGTPVRFVGTCTIGTDHLDTDYLASRGIAFAYAPGSNATSVAEYIVAVMLRLGGRLGTRLAGKSVGIIGVGNVGTRVERRCRALGMKVLLNDPPLARRTHDRQYRALDDVLAGADIVTLHVPLTGEGPDATRHMVNEEFLAKMKPEAWLLNSSRGAVHDTPALLAAKRSGRLGALYLDVWENEPEIDVELLGAADIASPHVAGYSADGKAAGVVDVHRAACGFVGREEDWDPRMRLPPPPNPDVRLSECGGDSEDALRGLVSGTYDFAADDARMREMLDLPPAERPKRFDALRRDYPCRREFRNTRVTLEGESRALAPVLEGIGFTIA